MIYKRDKRRGVIRCTWSS